MVLSERQQNVLNLLRSQEWSSTVEISSVEVGGSEGMRRLRELRVDHGYNIIKRHKEGSTQYEYKLVE